MCREENWEGRGERTKKEGLNPRNRVKEGWRRLLQGFTERHKKRIATTATRMIIGLVPKSQPLGITPLKVATISSSTAVYS